MVKISELTPEECVKFDSGKSHSNPTFGDIIDFVTRESLKNVRAELVRSGVEMDGMKEYDDKGHLK